MMGCITLDSCIHQLLQSLQQQTGRVLFDQVCGQGSYNFCSNKQVACHLIDVPNYSDYVWTCLNVSEHVWLCAI